MDPRELLAPVKLFVLDMDGTFYLDDNIIPNSVGWYLREGDTDLPTAES